MRNTIIIAILFMATILSCSKQETNNSLSPTHHSDDKKTSNIDSINVAIDESISIDPELCDSLGVDDFDVLAGNYYLVFNTANPYGIVAFNIDTTTVTMEPGGGGGVGIIIKIAKKYHRKCPNCYCCCGIGFRCGLVEHDPKGTVSPGEQERYLDVTISFTSTQMIIKMEEEIPIGDTGWEL